MPNKPEKDAYSGILAEPMLTWSVLTAPTDEDLQALIDEKMKALFAHFGLDSGEAYQPGPKMAAAWANLAWHLARQHVPGFRGALRKRGKPATRKNDDVDLVMYVELLKRRDGLSERKAVKWIASQRLVPGIESTLLQRYKRAKKQFVPLFRLFDNIAAIKGKSVLIDVMQDALLGDDKKTFLSPG